MPDANVFARDWIAAWNARDLEHILALYADDIVLFSPHAKERVGTGRIVGIGPLRAYWTAGLAALPDLRFELERVLVGHECMTLVYRNRRGQDVAETFEFGPDDLVSRSYACYASAP